MIIRTTHGIVDRKERMYLFQKLMKNKCSHKIKPQIYTFNRNDWIGHGDF
jgi:hypothetical protein